MPGACALETYQLLRRTAFPAFGLKEMSLLGLIKRTLMNNILKNIISVKTTTSSFDFLSWPASVLTEVVMPNAAQ